MSGRTQQHRISSRRRKAHIQNQLPPVYTSAISSYQDKDNDFLCSICFEIISEAHMTKCGHSFCYQCIRQSLMESKRCPRCNYAIEENEPYFPNFQLNELIQKYKAKLSASKKQKLDMESLAVSVSDSIDGDVQMTVTARGAPTTSSSTAGSSISSMESLCSLIEDNSVNLHSVNSLLQALWQKKQALEGESCATQNQILKEFLDLVHERKQKEMQELTAEISLLKSDLQVAQRKVEETHMHLNSSTGLVSLNTTADNYVSNPQKATGEGGFNGSKTAGRHMPHTSLAVKRRKVHQHFDDLEKCYFHIRKKALPMFGGGAQSECTSHSAAVTSTQRNTATHNTTNTSHHANAMRVSPSSDNIFNPGLEEFTESLAKFTRFSSIRTLANLGYATDIYSTSSIVSSIEFDRDCDHFAIAGVTKKIKIYDYDTVIKDTVDMHYPINEMICNSKISSVIWNSYHKGMLASSDYEGSVSIWDAYVGTKTKVYQEHEKRCWSVDFNRMDPKLLASGSDDSKVKLWHTNMEHSIECLEAKANVCCVKFNPSSRYHIAYGSADHCVHYYDLRNTRQPITVFKGHRKAVSYAKFLDATTLVSASTDSQLKLWSTEECSGVDDAGVVPTSHGSSADPSGTTMDSAGSSRPMSYQSHRNYPHCIRTFSGHVNEKNFVGLATDGDYIACGSENNSLYVYYKGLSKQLLTYKFDPVKTVLEREKKEEDINEFVSAVSWKPNSNVIVAANSQGIIKVLELV